MFVVRCNGVSLFPEAKWCMQVEMASYASGMQTVMHGMVSSGSNSNEMRYHPSKLLSWSSYQSYKEQSCEVTNNWFTATVVIRL